MMCSVVTWDGSFKVWKLHVRMHIPPQVCLIRGIKPVRLTSGGYVRVCIYLGHLVGKKEENRKCYTFMDRKPVKRV